MIEFEINLARNASMAPQTANYGKGAYEETGGMGSTSFDPGSNILMAYQDATDIRQYE